MRFLADGSGARAFVRSARRRPGEVRVVLDDLVVWWSIMTGWRLGSG